MACYVIIIGRLPEHFRSPLLEVDDSNLRAHQGSVQQPCTGCHLTTLATLSNNKVQQTAARSTGIAEMFVLSFDGINAQAQLDNAVAWMESNPEHDWLSDPNKTIYTIKTA
jgi:hypothetical protein